MKNSERATLVVPPRRPAWAAVALFSAACSCSALGADATIGGPPAGYDLAPSFTEEFNGTKLDERVWGTVYADPDASDRSVLKRTLWGNGERQVYFDKRYLALGVDPFQVKDGVLKISALPLSDRAHEAVMIDLARLGPKNRADPTLRALRYSSGMITGRRKFAQRFGYFEARMRWTGAKGVWPGFWLLRQDSHWPPEIDVMEALGHERGIVYSSVHSAVEPRNTTKPVTFDGEPGEFHRFGALWLPDRIDYYIDGRKTVSIPSSPDMDQPMYMLVTLAVGGKWPGYPDAAQTWPVTLEVDYVRAWKLASLPKTGD